MTYRNMVPAKVEDWGCAVKGLGKLGIKVACRAGPFPAGFVLRFPSSTLQLFFEKTGLLSLRRQPCFHTTTP